MEKRKKTAWTKREKGQTDLAVRDLLRVASNDRRADALYCDAVRWGRHFMGWITDHNGELVGGCIGEGPADHEQVEMAAMYYGAEFAAMNAARKGIRAVYTRNRRVWDLITRPSESDKTAGAGVYAKTRQMLRSKRLSLYLWTHPAAGFPAMKKGRPSLDEITGLQRWYPKRPALTADRLKSMTTLELLDELERVLDEGTRLVY
jgi:hypothetical protein